MERKREENFQVAGEASIAISVVLGRLVLRGWRYRKHNKR